MFGLPYPLYDNFAVTYVAAAAYKLTVTLMLCEVLTACLWCRDNYDKEMKEKSGHRPKVSSKTKKPDQHTYVIPSARADDDAGE